MDAVQLEQLIRSVTGNPLGSTGLVQALLQSRIAVPLDRSLENGSLPKDFRPLTLNSPAGFAVVATFTTVDKAAPWVSKEPAYSNVLLTDFTWALGIARPPFGLAVNPGYRYSFVLSPGDVQAAAERPGPAS
ncbi:MAG: SseB family protein [Lysobacteraceae bacterium]|nr:MAG: SseB family protein [Xanthomonadaceae bacterium]